MSNVKSTKNKLMLENLEKYDNFINKYRVKDGEYTHTAFGPPWGKYNIPDNKLEEFYGLYASIMGKVELHITEKPKNVGPLLIDIDFKFDKDHKARQYNDKTIEYVITRINTILKKYYKLTARKLKSFVFEKPVPSHIEKNNIYKDGFHIVYPHLSLPVEMRYMVLDDFKKKVESEDEFTNLPFTNGIDDVIDTCVVNRNGWMMYRSRKHDGQLYELTNIYKYNLEKENIKDYTEADLVRLMSTRIHKEDDIMEFKEEIAGPNIKKQMDIIMEKYEGRSNRNKKPNNNDKKSKPVRIDSDDSSDDSSDDGSDDESDDRSDDESDDNSDFEDSLPKNKKSSKNKKNSNDSDIEAAKKLVMMLSDKRADDFKKWIQVGWALHNTSPTLLNVFKKFSKKCPDKYDEQGCENVWAKARNEGVTIASIHMWARKDSPKKYARYIRENMNSLFTEAETGTEYDVAKVVYELYKHQYKCSSIRHNVWYEFQGHRWVEIESAFTLKIKIAEDLSKEFAKLNAYYYTKASTSQGLDSETFIKKANNIMKLMLNLRKSFKNRVLDDCAILFYDAKFEEKLDSKRHLIGFDNGVYDLQNNCFREGTPDDYITFSVGYDYVPYTMDHPHVEGIMDYFNKVMREDDMRKYILTLLASYLDGFNENQKVIIWTGSGSNGKSKTVEFFQLVIGDYAGVLPITMLTKKAQSVGSATPELADMRGKRFVVFQEPESDDKLYVGKMKELSGNDKILARKLFKDPFYFKPQFKMILTCNKLPHIPSTDGGTWRRLRVSPWESEFVDLDRKGLFNGKPLKDYQFPKEFDLDDKFEEWKQAFMWLLITKYYREFKKNGIDEPEKVTVFTKKYNRSSDYYLEFIEENLKVTGNKRDTESLAVIYSVFKNWYKDSYATGKAPPKKEMLEYFANNKYLCKSGYIYGVKFVMEEKVAAELDEGDAEEE